MPIILLTDPEQRAALAAARSLHRAGYVVHTMGVTRGLAGVSKAVSAHWPCARVDMTRAEACREAVASVVTKMCADVVIPVSDFASRSLLGHDGIVGTRIAGPSAEAYARASDKAELLMLAQTIGLRVPRQHTLQANEQVPPDFAKSGNAFVIKPSRSEVEVEGRTQKLGVRYVDSASQLSPLVGTYPVEAFPLLLQERTIGEGVGVFLFRTGQTTALSFGHRRLHEKPPAGGVSTYREAIAVPADLKFKCEQLLDALDYNGAAMIEFKRDVRTGEYVLMEINARLWGSLQLAIDAGVDFPCALVSYALGHPVQPPANPRAGVRSVWELGELDHAIALARGSRESLHLPPDVNAGMAAALRALGKRTQLDHLEVFRWSDPAPFFAEAWRWLRRVS